MHLAHFPTEHREPPVLLVGRASGAQLTEAADRLARQEPRAVDPQQLAQRRGVASVGLPLLAFFGLDQDHLPAAVVLQHPLQPVVEAAHLKHGDERLPARGRLTGQPREERVHLRGLRGHLAGLHDVAVFVAERDSQLTGVLVDSEVQHRDVLLSLGKSGTASLPNRATAPAPRPSTLGKVISKIGKAAQIVVDVVDPGTGRPIKYASAHDLRRSCGERLREAGVPPLIICRLMRHSSWETTQRHYAPGDIQNEATELRRLLVRDNDNA